MLKMSSEDKTKKHYKKLFEHYNEYIKKNFGREAVIDLNDINKRSFEKQVYESVSSNYKGLLKNEDDFKKELKILDANLYGLEKRNYNFLIPLMVIAFSLVGTYYGIIIKLNESLTVFLIASPFAFLLLVIAIYIYFSRRQHDNYCNLLAYYKICIGAVENLYDIHKEEEQRKQKIKEKEEKEEHYKRIEEIVKSNNLLRDVIVSIIHELAAGISKKDSLFKRLNRKKKYQND